MENPFYKVMAGKSDSELMAIVEQRDRYEPEAIIAVFEELERRQLVTPELFQVKTRMLEIKKERDETVVRENQQLKDDLKKAPRTALALLIPTKQYYYTPLILYMNIAVWLLMVATGVDAVQPSVEHLINWGGNLRGLTLEGQPWRLFTCVFLHGGIFHLALNMYALLQVGSMLEMKFGNHRYFLCYIAAGVLASVASVSFNDNIVSVGASGAIFGLYGLFLSLLITKSIDIPQESRKNFLSSTTVFIFYNLVFGFAKEGIDNAAHIGGLVSGFIFGIAYFATAQQPERSKIISGTIIALVAIAVFLTPYFITNKYGEYLTTIETFTRNEEKAMWMYKEDFPGDDPDDISRFRDRLRNEGVDLWKENLSLINGLTDMPEPLQLRIDLLKTYCQLRIQSCEAMSAMVADNSEENAARVESIDLQIGTVIENLDALNK